MKNTIFALNTVHKQIAAMLIAMILMWALGATPWMLHKVEAAQLSNISDLLSDSDRNVVSNHTIKFTTSATGAVADGENFVITFPAGFVVSSSLNEDDVDLHVAGGDQTVVNLPDLGPGQWGLSTTTTSITITSDGVAIGTSTNVVLYVGTHASSTGTGVNQITNPNPGGPTSYPITVTAGTAAQDTGVTRVAIIDNVVMSASVDTILTFNIYGTASSTTINGVSTFATSTATSMAFGTLEANVSKVLGQRLVVQTNAKNGYSVTIVQDSNLISGSLADIDLFVDGDATSTPVAWQAPSGNIADENTWGHYGITSEDDSLSGVADPFGSALFAGNFASSTPLEVLYHNGPSSSGTSTSVTRIAIKIEIDALQEAANDYANTLTYVCTPIF